MSDTENRRIMADNIMYYMDLYGKTRTDICRDLGYKYTTVTGWVTAEKYPRIDKIEALARYFGVTKADLVESRKAGGKSDEPGDSATERKLRFLMRKTEELSPSDQEKIMRYFEETVDLYLSAKKSGAKRKDEA